VEGGKDRKQKKERKNFINTFITKFNLITALIRSVNSRIE
jgi:hypothetical protein